MKRKFFSSLALFLALVMLLAAAPVLGLAPMAFAEPVASGDCGYDGDNLTWTLDNTGTLTISGTGEMCLYFWEFDPWYDYRSSITSVVINDGATLIGDGAFENCTALTSVVIPDTVEYILAYAFSGCTALESIVLPNSVVNSEDSCIEDMSGIFNGCSSLKNVTISTSMKNISNKMFENCTALETITIPDSVEKIGSDTFKNCADLTNVTLSNKITTLPSMFTNCTSLESISIPEKVTRIQESFSGCTALKSINIDAGNTTYSSVDGVLFEKAGTTLTVYPSGKEDTAYEVPAGVTNIKTRAIQNCAKLESVTIPESVTTMGTFANCPALTGINVDADNAAYSSDDGVLLNKDGTTLIRYPEGKANEYEIPDTVISINSSAFINCASLTDVIIPDSVESIGSSVFSNCSALESIVIPESVTSIGSSAFSKCSALESIVIPDSVTSIGTNAFSFCSSLESIVIPDSVTSIGYAAFSGCGVLTDVYYSGTQTEWDLINIANSNESIDNATQIYKSGVSGDVKWLVEDDGTLTISGNGAMKNYNSGTAPWSDYGTEVISVVIENGVTSIGAQTFSDFVAMTTVTIPSSVESIGDSAFSGCAAIEAVNYNGDESSLAAIVGNSELPVSTSHVHYSVGVITTPATCTTNGEMTYTCTTEGCSETRVEIIFATGHTWNSGEMTTAVTCTTAGEITFTCTAQDCGATKTEAIQPLNHINAEDIAEAPATCAADGYTMGSYCPDCDTWLSGHDVISAFGHTWDEGAVTQAAACEQDGIRTFSCTTEGCDGTKTEPIPATNHPNKYTQAEAPATCTESGYTAGSYCPDCGTWLSGHDVIPALGHTWDEGAVTQAAACEQDGIRTFYCTTEGCDGTKTEPIPATNHPNKYTQAEAPATCTEIGYTAGSYCPDCGTWLSGHEIISVLGHNYGDWVSNNDGTHKRICENDALHFETADCTYTLTVTPATCINTGYTTYTCEDCAYSYTADETALTAHSFGDWVVTVEATCYSYGEDTRYCTVTGCTESEARSTAMTPHNYSETGEIGIRPSCYLPGAMYRYCTNPGCSEYLVGEAVPVLEHQLSEWTVVSSRGFFNSGVKERHCTHADCTYSEEAPSEPSGLDSIAAFLLGLLEFLKNLFGGFSV